jgi:hypothetical protein
VPASASAGVTVPSTALQAAEVLTTQSSLVTGASWVLQPKMNAASEVAPTVGVANTALLGFPTIGSQFLVFSSGNATHGETANQTSYNDAEFENALGTEAHDEGTTEIEGTGEVNDVTILHVAINVPTGKNCLALDFRFLSQEYPQYVNQFNDGFLVELDADNWEIRPGGQSFNAPANFATDSGGQPLSVNSTGTLALSPAEAAGSGFEGFEGEAFGGGTALLSAETPVAVGAHNLYFSVFDARDHSLDSGAFVDHLRAFHASTCPAGAVTEAEAATPPAPVATSEVPVISGSAVVGDTLSATTGTFTGEELTYTYQWLLEGVPISGAKAATYVPTSPDIGKTLSVAVTATNPGGAVSETSTSTVAVKAAVAAPAATATVPVISGSTIVGSTLSATTGTFTGTELVYTYQWLREGVPVSGAKSATYLLAGADAGHKMSVVVTATNSGGEASETSALTATVVPKAPAATATVPVITGSAIVGSTLSATTGTFTGESIVYTYQWLREGVPISGAKSAGYLLTSADTGDKVSVVVTATNAGGEASETSALTATVVPKAPVATATVPVISGSAIAGSTLSATTGAFTGEGITYTYQWLREGVPISGAKAAGYLLTSSDTGHKVSVIVTATNAGGEASETSALTATVVPVAPVATATVPVISGSTVVGSTLSATTGTFTGEGITYTYQWLREGVPISGAKAAGYLLTSADNGHKISVVVTATNASGEASETSALTAAVAPAAPVATATLPVISGPTIVGSTLSATTGTFTGQAIVYTYQWLREGVPISGAKAAGYLLTSADNGHKISVVVTATNGGGEASEPSALSTTVTPVAPSLPIVEPEIPQISGSPLVGDTLSASTGNVTGETLTYTYQWLLDGVPITGATAVTYVITSADVGHQLSVLVTATNAGGNAVQTSAQSATVALAPTLALAAMPVAGLTTPTLPTASTTTFIAPSACTSTRSETIHWRTAAGVRLTHIRITLNGRPYSSLSGSVRHASISFLGRGPGSVLVRIAGATATGGRYSSDRVFHPCIPGLTSTKHHTQFLSRS